MKQYKFIILFFLLKLLCAQSTNLVEYKFSSLSDNNLEIEYLIFNETELYYGNISNKLNLDYEDDKLDKTKFNYEPFYKNLQNDSIYQRKIVSLKKNSSDIKYVVMVEKQPLINWKITKESLKILNYTCYKATTTFRGREYTAWFTPEIPFNYGPWKLQGLPGLILKADTDMFSYEAKRIVLNSSKIPLLENLKKLSTTEKKYTSKQTFEFENYWLEVVRGFTISNLPTASKVVEKPLRADVRELTLDE